MKTWTGCLRDKQQGRCIRYYLLDNQNVCQVSRMMNIQQSVRLIIFIYQQESLLCCSMSTGYWCNIKWVLFSYMGGDISCAPPKKQQQQQQQQQETAGGWSEHWGCKWREGLRRSSHHGAHFCSGRQVGGGRHRCPPCKVTPRSSTLFSCSRTSTTQTALEPVLGAGSRKHARNHLCGVGDWVSVPRKVACYIGATCTSPLADLRKPSGQRKLREHLSLTWHIYMNQAQNFLKTRVIQVWGFALGPSQCWLFLEFGLSRSILDF